MLKRKLYKVLSFVLLLAMVLVLMVACGNPATPAETTTGTTAAGTTAAGTTAALTAPPSDQLEYIEAAKTPVKLKMFFNVTWFDAANWGKDIVSKLMMQETGVDLSIETPAADDNQKLTLMLASGDKLPDIIVVDWMNDCLFKMMKDQKIYSIDDLAKQYAPNMLKLPFYAGNHDIWTQKINNGDGKLYSCFSGTCTDASRLKDGKQLLGIGGNYMIRKDIYEALGSPPLKTTDDMEAVLKQVKAKYPNITHPLMLDFPVEGVGYESHSLFTVSFSFGCTGYDWNDNGTIRSHIQDPRYKQSLLWINKLYREGLINISDFTDKQDQQDATLGMDKVFAYVGGNRSGVSGASKELAKVNPNASYEYIDPILAPGVDKWNNPASFSFGWMCPVITKDCTNPERAIKFLEYCCTDHQQAMAYAGREGVDWQWGGPDGKDIVLIGDAKAAHDKSIEDWKKTWGCQKEYSFCGNQYYRDCLSAGNAETDPLALKELQMKADCDISSLQYGMLSPENGSDEQKISQKCADVILQFVGKCCTAKSEAEATAIYNDAIKKMTDLGIDKISTYKTAKWQATKDMFAKMLQ